MAINLKAKMSMDSRGFVAGANNAKIAMSSLGTTMSGMKSMLTAGIFMGAIAGLKAMATQSLKTADDIMNWSARMGVSAKVVQELKIEADEAGIAFKGLMTAFGTLARTSQEAQAGNKKYKESFEALGLSMAELEGMSQEEMFNRLADAVQNSGNRVETLGHLFNTMGGQAEKILPILDALGKRNEEVLSETTVQILDRTNDKWEKFKRGASNTVAGLTAAVSTFTEEIFAGGKGFFGNIANIGRAMTFSVDPETGERAQLKSIKEGKKLAAEKETQKKKEIEGQAELKRKAEEKAAAEKKAAEAEKAKIKAAQMWEKIDEANFNRSIKRLSNEKQIAALQKKIKEGQERAEAAGEKGDEVTVAEELLDIQKLQGRVDTLKGSGKMQAAGGPSTAMQSVGAFMGRAPVQTQLMSKQLEVQTSMDNHLNRLHQKLVIDAGLSPTSIYGD